MTLEGFLGMHGTRWIVGATMLGAALTTAQSQTTEAGPGSGPASLEDRAASGLKPFALKKAACREVGMRTGLHGADLADHVQLCFEEAKLACLKQAIARKVRGPERRGFIQICTDGTE